MLILDLITTLTEENVDYALVGGYALGFHGIVRATMDIDLVVNVGKNELEKVEKALRKMGLTSRLPLHAFEIAAFREEYIRERNLIAWSFIDLTEQTRQVDVLLTHSLKELDVQKIKWHGKTVKVASLRTLLKMKLAAGRPQDMIDVEKIREKIATP